MADKKRKDDDEERADDAADQPEKAEEKAEDEGEAEGDEASGEDLESEGDEGDDGSAEGEDDEDAAAKRVAKALGVGEDEGEAAGDKGEDASAANAPEVIPNRALRRREEAMARRKKRKGITVKTVSEEDLALPKDKNARAKELLKRRREQAAGPRAIQLLPGEMVDDALARSTSAASKWIRQNFNKLQWVILAALVGFGGYLVFSWQSDKKSAASTDDLLAGVAADLGRVLAEDKRTDEEKEADPAKVFKTAAERNEAALAAYRKTIAAHPDSAVAQLAKLGEAGVLLDKREWPAAMEAFSAVLASKLAAADLDVKGRATEGLALAKEGKGDLDGALAGFKDLEGIDARGYKELGMYQQGRILLAKGDKDKATEILKQVREKLQTAGGDASSWIYLQGEVDETLRRIDPSLVPTKGAAAMGGPKGNSVSSDEMGKIRKLIDDAAKKKPQQEEH